MMTTSSFMSTLTAFAFVVGSLLRIALKVSIFSSLIHSHKLKVRSGLLEAAALFKLVLMVLCRRLISPGGNCACHCLGLTGEDLMVGVHQFNHPVSTASCPHVKPAEVYSCSACD